MITVIGTKTRHYLHVTTALHRTVEFPDLCTFTADGEFGFVFCKLAYHYEDIVKYVRKTNFNVENIAFWSE